VPYTIEPAAGATRAMMAFLLAAYHEDEVEGETRTVLRSTGDWRQTKSRSCRFQKNRNWNRSRAKC